MALRGLRQAMGDGCGLEPVFRKKARMPEIAQSRFRDWLVPPIVIPASLLLFVLIVSLCR
jgi:hypothetical protein